LKKKEKKEKRNRKGEREPQAAVKKKREIKLKRKPKTPGKTRNGVGGEKGKRVMQNGGYTSKVVGKDLNSNQGFKRNRKSKRSKKEGRSNS